MRYISTSDANITFTDTNGKVMVVPKNRVYTHFNVDTITFLLIERYDNEGICLFSTKAEDLEINGTTYTYEQLLDGEGISDLFSPTGLSFEVVEELPETGSDGVIYLVPNGEDSYTEYFWIADEQRYEMLGDVGDIDLTKYYTKTQVDTALSAKVDQTEFDTKEEVISTALNELEENKQDKLTAGQNITIDANNIISASGGTQQQADWNQTDDTAVDYIKNKPTIPDTSDFVTKAEYNPKEVAIAEALTDLNENKADKSEIPVVPDMSNYYTKTETDNTFVSKADFDVKEEVISTGLNTLNTSKADASSVYTKTEIDAMIGNINTILASI